MLDRKNQYKIEFLFFDACPAYEEALKNLQEALQQENISAELKVIKINSLEEANQRKFQGSPSIRINGEDLEGRNGEYNFSCRIYHIEGKSTGIPTKTYIKQRLRKITR